MHVRPFHLLCLLVIGAAFFALGQMSGRRSRGEDFAAPLAIPKQGEPDHRFHFLSAWETAQIPRSQRFDPPMGTEHGGLIYNAQRFWEMNAKRGGHHTGDDLNGIGGMNTDLGDPVFSTADGLVIYVGEPSAGWGKLVVVAHWTADGRPLHAMYAHLDRVDCRVGNLIARGEQLGSVGTANGNYPAHLHFEMRSSDGVDIGAGYSMYPLNRLDPSGTIKALRDAPLTELGPAVLKAALPR